LAKPTLANPASAAALAAGLPALLIEASRVAASVLQGTHGRRRVGLGESFWQFRAYQPGDTLNRIDWRQSGKSDRLFIRETEWEAAHTVLLWRDTSASMDYHSAGNLPTKRARADLLLLALASLLLRGGERVGLLQDNVPPPVSHPAGLDRLANSLNAGSTGADLPLPLRVSRHSTIIMCGDFLSPLPRLAEAVQAFAQQGAYGILIQTLDPAEITLPFAGRVQFEGSEGEIAELVPRAEALRDDYRARLARQQQGLETIAKEAGWRVMLDRTDRPALEALQELYLMLGGEH
jgi:uncharacterized protein (DUF58 family)